MCTGLIFAGYFVLMADLISSKLVSSPTPIMTKLWCLAYLVLIFRSVGDKAPGHALWIAVRAFSNRTLVGLGLFAVGVLVVNLLVVVVAAKLYLGRCCWVVEGRWTRRQG